MSHQSYVVCIHLLGLTRWELVWYSDYFKHLKCETAFFMTKSKRNNEHSTPHSTTFFLFAWFAFCQCKGSFFLIYTQYADMLRLNIILNPNFESCWISFPNTHIALFFGKITIPLSLIHSLCYSWDSSPYCGFCLWTPRKYLNEK